MGTVLLSHRLELVVVHPQIAPNTGNIARLCVATGTPLHLVRPLGFVLSDRQLKRSAMDYWPRLELTLHDDLLEFLHWLGSRRAWWFDSTGEHGLFDVAFEDGDVLIFGSETRGLDPALLAERVPHTVCIPQVPGERCLNLATAAGIGLYAALARMPQARGNPL